MSRLVTFLGIPLVARQGASAQQGYQSTTYCLYDEEGKPTSHCPPTPWIAVALARFFNSKEVHVLATQEAWQACPPGANRCNGEALMTELYGLGAIKVEHIEIPTGLSARELWQQFERLKTSLRAECVDEIVLDITHGLRSQPFFAGAVMSFVSMVDESGPKRRVVYGAHDVMRTLGLPHTPIIELTAFADLLAWTHDLVLFLKSGRLGDLAKRTGAIGPELITAWKQAGGTDPEANLRRLGAELEQFARDLQTIRTGALLLGSWQKGGRSSSSARRLLEAAEQARHDAKEHLPPLADVLDRIRSMAERLVFAGYALVGEEARKVLANLADLYLQMGRYIEALTTVREAFISLEGPEAIACPGLPDYDHRARLERERGMQDRLPCDWRSIADLRNDLDHAGYRKQPNDGETLIRGAEQLVAKLRTCSPGPAIFVNISNHSSSAWGEAQKQAAARLADRLIDVPFPDVPPEAEPSEIESLAEEIVRNLPAGTTHALVQGEFTLTTAIVRRLQAQGICCLAATTERRVEKTAEGDEVRRFKFVRFRPYPQLA